MNALKIIGEQEKVLHFPLGARVRHGAFNDGRSPVPRSTAAKTRSSAPQIRNGGGREETPWGSIPVCLPESEIQRVVNAVLDGLDGAGLRDREDCAAGYLAPKAAGEYLGVSAKRIYDLKSMGALEPDGYDGRTPLYTRATLDAYVLGSGS